MDQTPDPFVPSAGVQPPLAGHGGPSGPGATPQTPQTPEAVPREKLLPEGLLAEGPPPGPGTGPLVAPPRHRLPWLSQLPVGRKTAIGAGLFLAGVLAGVLWATTGSGTDGKPVNDFGDDKANRRATALWLDQGGQAAISEFSTDMHAMATSTSRTAMTDACATLKADLQDAKALPPIPDPEAQHHWSAGVTAALDGANACVDAHSASVDSVRQQFLTRMEDNLTESGVEFSKLRARLLEFAHTTS